MSNKEYQSHALVSHPGIFLETHEQAATFIEKNSERYGRFIVITDIPRRFPDEVRKIYEQHDVTVAKKHVNGNWNNIFRIMGSVYDDREEFGIYGNARDVCFILTITPKALSKALSLHRTVPQLSCRELYYLNTLEYGEEQDDAIEAALRYMPNVPTPIKYNDLTPEQKFELTAFEFTRYLRPVHCIDSTKLMTSSRPFYNNIIWHVGTQEVA